MPSTPRLISSERLQRKRHLHVIDVRREDERRGELGFIPGSLFAPEGRHLDELLDLIPEEDAVVLSCLGGARAQSRITAQLEAGEARTFYNLEGGLLGWRAAGFPVASFIEQDSDHLTSETAEDFFVQMRACFVGEIVEIIAERDLDLNPLDLLDTSSQLAQIYHNGTPFEERLINFAGYVSWQVGTPLDHIARNMSWALAHRHFIAGADASQLTW